MARALRSESGRGLKREARAATVGCADCCGPAPVGTFFQACPCIAYENTPCAIPDEPCIYIDSRAVLSDGDVLAEVIFYEVVIVNVGGICYTVTQTLWSDDPNLTGANIIQDGAVRIEGDGVVVTRNPDCVEGCAELNVGPEFFEVFSCNGCPDANGNRWFACASQVAGWSVLQNYGCIDRTIGYTQAQAESLGLLIIDPAPLLVWKRGPGFPVLVPAESCCYENSFAPCVGLNCLRGRDWTGFGGSDQWFPLDTCCGTQQGLRYGVELSYVRTIISPGNDPVTTTTTATVTSITPRDGGGSNVNLNINTRQVRASTGVVFDNNGPATVSLEPQCCLPYSGVVPMLDRIVPASSLGLPDIPIPNAPGFIYSNKVPNLAGGDSDNQRVTGWNETAWAVPMRLSERNESEGTYESSGGAFGGCGVWNFRHDATMTYTDFGTDSVHVNLTVTVLPDQNFPCAYAGGCGSGGWGGNIGALLP